MNNLLELVYNAMNDKQADDLLVIDFRNHSPYVDYFVIGTAKNYRMAKSIIENIEEVSLNNGYNVKSIDFNENSRWLLIDLDEIVCHVFIGEERKLYNLEGLWKDLPLIKM